MMRSFLRRLLAVVAFSVSFVVLQAQAGDNQPIKKENLPYQVITSGKQIIIKSNRNIQHVMLWTSSGHRVVEQRDINTASYSFKIPIDEKIFFLMLGLEGGKIYTEKIGVQ